MSTPARYGELRPPGRGVLEAAPAWRNPDPNYRGPGPQQDVHPAPPDVHRRGKTLATSLEWLHYMGELPADYLNVPTTGGWGLLISGRVLVVGGSFNNTATTVANIKLLDGQDVNGNPLAYIQIPASSDKQWDVRTPGIIAEMGLWAAAPGGTVAGVLYVVHLWRYPYTTPGQ